MPTPVDFENQMIAKQILETVVSEFGGSVSFWERSRAIGLWDYADVSIGDVSIRVGASSGCIVSVNGHPFDPDMKHNDNLESVRKSIQKVLDDYARWHV